MDFQGVLDILDTPRHETITRSVVPLFYTRGALGTERLTSRALDVIGRATTYVTGRATQHTIHDGGELQ